MRQRVMIAMALALNPEIIDHGRADDRARRRGAARDPAPDQANCRDELGFAVLFITHDLSLLLEISDRIAIMYAGRVVETAPARTMHETPRTRTRTGCCARSPSCTVRARNCPASPAHRRTCVPCRPAARSIPRCRFAVDTCRSHRPGLLPADDGVQVACALYDASVYAGDLPAELSLREETR